MPLDFSNARYLGLSHASQDLPPWQQLTTGFPAAFQESPAAIAAGQAIARLQGLADGVVAPSSLHLFWDWFGLPDPRRDVVFADKNLYRVGAWGVERAAGRGVPVAHFSHQSARSLQDLLERNSACRQRRRPIVVTDGWCPLCGKAAPLRDYLALVELLGGWLVVDDTQGLGIFGKPAPGSGLPLGTGGGGLLPFLGIRGERVISISSLAKAFGAPLAVLSGSAEAVQAFRDRSETRVFASPVSSAALAAASNALKINAVQGDALRRNLLRNVRQWQACLSERGWTVGGGDFPVQVLEGCHRAETYRRTPVRRSGFAAEQGFGGTFRPSLRFLGEAARRLHGELLLKGIRTVLSTGHDGEPVLCFLLNARQAAGQVAAACEAVFSCMKRSAVSTWSADRTGALAKFY